MMTFQHALNMDVTKPCEFIGFGAMDVTTPYEFMRFGAILRACQLGWGLRKSLLVCCGAGGPAPPLCGAFLQDFPCHNLP